MRKIKVLITNLSYLNHNYGVQGILFPFMDKLNKHFSAEYGFVSSEKYYDKDAKNIKKFNINPIKSPSLGVMLAKNNLFLRFLFNVFYKIKGKKTIKSGEYDRFYSEVKNYDIVINLSGIQFIGNVPSKKKYLTYFSHTYAQWFAKQFGKLYLEYTKSYGPITGKFYRYLVKRHFKKLPFLLVRGENNLEEVEQLNLGIPVYSFPDISLSLEPEDKNWAIVYLGKMGLDISKNIVGLSPSSVLAGIEPGEHSLCGDNHLVLCEKIIDFYKREKNQVIILPHSIGYNKDQVSSCDLVLAGKIYERIQDKKDIFFINDRELTYKQTRAIIGLMDFYITGRYHSVASVLYMGIPVVSLSWHIKYKDIMSLFLDDFPLINCRKTDVEKALRIIKKYYYDEKWFNKEKVLERREKINSKIDKSIALVAEYIKNNHKG
jgi:polysaccharide pyruvyl transferase WcaK-like protein